MFYILWHRSLTKTPFTNTVANKVTNTGTKRPLLVVMYMCNIASGVRSSALQMCAKAPQLLVTVFVKMFTKVYAIMYLSARVKGPTRIRVYTYIYIY